MSKPTEMDMARLKRLGRYLVGHPRLVQSFKRQPCTAYLDVWVDTDYAGCLRTRRSTNGGVVTIGNHVVKHWSTTQNTVALSSGEAEYYGVVSGCAESPGTWLAYIIC